MDFIDIIGWIGSACVIYAFTMNIYGRLTASSQIYVGLNLIGSILLIINTYYLHAFPSMMVNVVWVAVSLGAILKKKN